MIKNFEEFNSEDIKNKEIKYFERELNARKNKRKNILDNDIIHLGEIIYDIKNEINKNCDYFISIGKRNLSENDKIHIQYDSEELGRIKIFKPEDDSYKGYFEVNGKTFESNADDLRIFYHYLLQIIKNKPLLNEGLRDKMKPKPIEEIKIYTKKFNPDQKILFGVKYSGLFWLIEEGINEGGDINQMDGSPLRLSVIKNDLETLKFLVENGADYNVADGFAVRYSSEYNYTEMLEYLIYLGAEVHSYSNYAFEIPISKGNINVIKILTDSKKFNKGHLPTLIKMCEDFNQSIILNYLKNKFNI